MISLHMDQNQRISEFPNIYPPQTFINQVYSPHHYDTMATNYVHSLTSTPYYYFIPRYSYVSGRDYPLHHYAHNVPQLGFVQATINPALGPPYTHENSNLLPPEGYPLNLESQEMIFHETKVEKLHGTSKEVEKKSIDEHLVHILEPFRQLYSEREETLKSIFPGLYSKLGEFFKKVNTLVSNGVKSQGERMEGKTLKRSLSMGSSSSTLKNEWFKVRPIDSEDTVITSSPDGKDVDA